jgi:hypothetical protein
LRQQRIGRTPTGYSDFNALAGKGPRKGLAHCAETNDRITHDYSPAQNWCEENGNCG